MFDFERPTITIEEESDDKRYAKIVCKPLERGYGTTLGNSLRRIMLSTLTGYAVSQIKIDGVMHEFSSIDGVKEDVSEIIMNLKDLAIKNNSDTFEEKVASIDVESDGNGETIVTADDIVLDQDLEIVNKDLIIAHLSGKNAKLHIQLVISPGRGYVPAEKNKEKLNGVGYIAIDSIYQPDERVNIKVENTRVGNQTDYDKLILEEVLYLINMSLFGEFVLIVLLLLLLLLLLLHDIWILNITFLLLEAQFIILALFVAILKLLSLLIVLLLLSLFLVEEDNSILILLDLIS